MRQYLLFILLITAANAFAQNNGLRFGAVGSTIINTNVNTNAFPFSPIVNFEMAAVHQFPRIKKFGVQMELGYTSKGGTQSSGPLSKSFTKHMIGYGNVQALLHYFINDHFTIHAGAAPSYMLLYKKFDKGNASNFYPAIWGRYKWDVPISLGITKRIGELNEINLRFYRSLKPFTETINFNPSSVDRYYHTSLCLSYTYFLGNKESE
jgi:hypothetical protein